MNNEKENYVNIFFTTTTKILLKWLGNRTNFAKIKRVGSWHWFQITITTSNEILSPDNPTKVSLPSPSHSVILHYVYRIDFYNLTLSDEIKLCAHVW